MTQQIPQSAPPALAERLKGAYAAADFTDRLLDDWQYGISPGLSTGWAELDDYYLVKKRQWTVVSGMPHSGKSTFVDNVMVGMARRHGWKFLVCSPETQPIERHIESLIEIYSGKKYISAERAVMPGVAITESEIHQALAFIHEHFYFICPDETDFNIDYLLFLAKEIKTDFFQYDGFLIDPYNELEHKRPAGFTETEYISSLLTKVRRFVRAEAVHLWFVAHPTKQTAVQMPVENKSDLTKKKIYQRTSLYDIAGGAHWYNKCDNGVIVYRNEHLETETTTVAIDKIRFRECGRKGAINFIYNGISNRLVPVTGEAIL